MRLFDIILRPFRAVADNLGGFFNRRLWSSVGGGRVTTSQETVSEDSALNYSAVWCATRLLCGTAASLPLPIYRGLDDEEREKAREHPVYRILNRRPNPELTAYNFRSVMWQWQVNWGNAYAEIQREGDDPEGEVDSVWPIHPCRVTPIRDEDGTLMYRVRGANGGSPEDVEAWRILHIPSIITYDGIVGQGVIEHARESIGAGIAAEKYGANFFGGAAVPRIAIKHPGIWKQEARDAFRKEWKEIYGGADGDRVALIEGGADIFPLSMSAEDSQFLGTRQFGVEEIARWYGIPPHLLQQLMHATMTNVEEMGRNFVSTCLNPWLELWEQVIAQKLLYPQDDEYFAEHNVDALQRGNLSARSAYYREMIGAAVMTRNEARRLENMPLVDGGDTFLVQGATVPLDEEGKPESDFAGTAQTPPATQQVDDTADETPPPDNRMQTVAASLHRVIRHDMERFLTKETKAIQSFTKKTEGFLMRVEQFYSTHATLVRDEVTETFGALGECGQKADAEAFVSAWVNEGKAAIVEASGTAKDAEGLAAAVQAVVESRAWVERPERAIEKVKHATAVV